MKNEIADRLEKYADEIRDSYDPKDNLRDVIADAFWYLIELSNDPVRLKIANKYVEYITSDTIGVSDYRETATPFSKSDAHKIINGLVVDIDD